LSNNITRNTFMEFSLMNKKNKKNARSYNYLEKIFDKKQISINLTIFKIIAYDHKMED